MSAEPECAQADEPVDRVAQRMRDRNIGFVPVCDEGGRVIGTVTDRDLAIRVLAEHLEAEETPVDTVMSRDLVVCSPDDDLHVAEVLMARNQKSRIICVDEARHPVGVLSVSDILRAERRTRATMLLQSGGGRER